MPPSVALEAGDQRVMADSGLRLSKTLQSFTGPVLRVAIFWLLQRMGDPTSGLLLDPRLPDRLLTHGALMWVLICAVVWAVDCGVASDSGL